MIWQSEMVLKSAAGLSEAGLIEAAQRGDLEAFNQLVITYQDQVFSLSRGMSGDDDLAEDITQETFLAAYRSLPRFRGGSFRGWLFRIAANACVDEFRKRRRHPVLSLEDREEAMEGSLLPSDFPGSGISPEKAYEQHEFEQGIQQAIDQLDMDQRAVVVLVDLQEVDYVAAARILGIPLGTLKSRLARARVQLRHLLKAKGAVSENGG